ncbi:acyl-CoA dehydrogenase family protein [Sphingobium cupriresistens]|uniref:Acyl-CoA dehydrogenase n=1 Tax=Sphingobium cupriresistens LL01 TaxID=1420583 RepID=A0A0J7XQB0_9SPHN|nr:acyl-CoA dehydrogenase family protein [Sphingobium cupriresistens]KMS53243.1 acyl-CoA dehydrogenase [Sphingobium cupriresistens LL01]
MNFDLSDEQKMLAEQARGLLGERSSSDRLRELIDAKAEWDEPLWREIADMGFLGVTVPEEFGGLGMTELDLGVISEELGRANTALPFFSSIVLVVDAINMAGSDAQKSYWLPKLVSGEAIGVFAYAEGPAGWTGDAIKARVEDGALSGTKTPVADGGVATLAVVLAKSAGKPVLALVDLAQPGVTRTRLDSFDELRAHYTLQFDAISAELLEALPAERVLDQLFDRAAVQAAFEAVGGADACLFMARDYAMERQIFGRPLSSYQAIKHKLADIAVGVELARSNAYFGAWAALNDPEALPVAAASARLTAIDAFENAARENIQVHGGIGYTFEANCHFYYRRERTLALSLGGREPWADRLIRHLPGSQFKAETV